MKVLAAYLKLDFFDSMVILFVAMSVIIIAVQAAIS